MKGVIFYRSPSQWGKIILLFRKIFKKTHLALSMDMLKTRHRENILFEACLESKQPCVIDNTNPEKKGRARYIELFKKHQFQVIGYYFQSDLNACLARNELRVGKEKKFLR